MMRRTKIGQAKAEYAVLVVVIVAALIAMQVYLRRGHQGNLRKTTDDIGVQFSPGATTSNITTETDTVTTESTDAGGDKRVASHEEVRRTGREVTPSFLEESWGTADESAGAEAASGSGEIEIVRGPGGAGSVPGPGGAAPVGGGTPISGGSGGGIGGSSGGSGGSGGGSGGGIGGGGTGGGSGGSGGGGGGIGSGSGGGGSAAPYYGSTLEGALGILRSAVNGLYFYNLIIEKGISVYYADMALYGEDPATTGAFWVNTDFNTIVVNELLRSLWPEAAVAAIIAHEATHADYSYNPDARIEETLTRHPELTASDLHIVTPPYNSIDQEYNAFRSQALVWNETKGGASEYNNDYMAALYAQGESFLKTEIRALYAEQGLPEY